MRDIDINNLNSYVTKNAHTDCEIDTYDALNESIVKPLNRGMKRITREDFLYFLCRMKIINLLSNISKVKI